MAEAGVSRLESSTSTSGTNDSDVFVFPASSNQQQLWFLYKWEPDSAAYNVPVAYRLKGALNLTALRQSLNEIVRRHESLRTTFASQGNETVQRIAPALTLDCPVIDLQEGPVREADIQRLVNREAQRPFNLETGPLVRAMVFRLAGEDHVLSWTVHHIVCDDWSWGVFVSELQALYAAFSNARPSPLSALPIQYADYAVWQRERLTGGELDRQGAYWKRQLADLGVLELPTDRPRPKTQTYRGGVRRLSMSRELTAALKTISLQEHATLFMTLAAAFQILLHRYSGQDDIILGVPVAGRNRSEIEELIGFFVNTLVLRSDLSGNPPFRNLLARVRGTALDAYAHQELPFDKIVEELQPQRDSSRHPLFQVMFALQKPVAELRLEHLTVSSVSVDTETAKFDLNLELCERDEELQGSLEYNTDLFDAATIERFVGHFQVLLKGIAAEPDRRLSEFPLLTEGERHQLLHTWNDTRADYPPDQCVHQLFEAQVARTPDAIAVVFEDQCLKYRELNDRANQLAHYLRHLDVGRGVLVGICAERSLEMVVGLLAILKAGGAYVPIDPTYPKNQLAFMLEDAAVRVLLTQDRLIAALPPHGATLVRLDADWIRIAQESTAPIEQIASAQAPAYMIYTSGSTGRPKGAINGHRGIVNRLLWMQDEYRLTSGDTVLQKTPFSFDVSVWEFFWPLLAGARLVVAKPGGHQDPAYLVKTIVKHRVSVLHFVPSMLRAFLQAAGVQRCQSLRDVICSGEALTADLVRTFYDRLPARLHNLYGPTEAAVDVTYWPCPRQSELSSVPIGRPVANTQCYVLDSFLQPVPVGTPGELHIGGVQVGMGYHRRPDLTAERFIVDPFRTEPNARLYRTGDLCRYLPSGDIEYLGRLDHQVKLRGVRIELSGIETALVELESVLEAVVTVREDRPGDQYLTAYVVPASGRSMDPAALRQQLKNTLPSYMVPQYFVELLALPLSPNGKIDRKQLPAPEHVTRAEGEALPAPRNATERRLAQIWAEVLGMPRVGIHDNFFDLGGHSLLAITLISRMAGAFNVELPLQDLADAPTVAQLAEKLAGPSGASDRHAPRTATEHRLLAIWERILDTAPIGVQDNFLELSGGSHVFDQMVKDIRSAFGVFAEGLPLSTIIKEPTVAALARIIDESLESSPSLVVPLQPLGSERPLFLIHAGGGYVFFYRALACQLAPDRPVYGVRAETTADGLGRPFDQGASVEELAARYITEIKAVQPKGPYSLGGACFGGVVAFEMAKQLRSRGEEVVGPVLLFDAFVWNNPSCRQVAMPPTGTGAGSAPLRQRVTAHLRRASQLGAGSAIWYLARKILTNAWSEAGIAARAARRELRAACSRRGRTAAEPSSFEERQLRMMEGILKTARRLLSTYTPGVYDGDIALFKASSGPDSEPLWNGLARGRTVVRQMPGAHLDMMEEPAVVSTAALVQECLAGGQMMEELTASTPTPVAPDRSRSELSSVLRQTMAEAVR